MLPPTDRAEHILELFARKGLGEGATLPRNFLYPRVSQAAIAAALDSGWIEDVNGFLLRLTAEGAAEMKNATWS